MDRHRQIFPKSCRHIVHVDTITASNRVSDAKREIGRPSFDKSQNGAGNQTEVRAIAGNILRNQ